MKRSLCNLAWASPLLVSIAGCSSIPDKNDALILDYASPSTIIVGSTAKGAVVRRGQCLRFVNRQGDARVFLPHGATYDANQAKITLPNGEGIVELGRTQNLSFEIPKDSIEINSNCSGEPLLILAVRD